MPSVIWDGGSSALEEGIQNFLASQRDRRAFGEQQKLASSQQDFSRRKQIADAYLKTIEKRRAEGEDPETLRKDMLDFAVNNLGLGEFVQPLTGAMTYGRTPAEQSSRAWMDKDKQVAEIWQPDRFEVSNIGIDKLTGHAPTAEFTKTIAGREYMDRPDNFGKSLRIGSNIELGATGLEEKRRADRKFLEIERPESRATVGLLGAQTGHANAGTGKLRAETKTELARLDSTSPVSPGYQPPTSAATGATGTDRKAEQNSRILQSVNSLLGRAGVDTVGVGAWLAKLPATAARDFQADLNTLKANIAFGELQEMRNASKTGGALGQVSERELTLLESSLAGLDQKQSVGNFKKNLQQIRASIARWNAAKGGGGESGVLDVTRDANGRLILPR